MAILLNITEGWTERIGPFTLRVDGVPMDLTGFLEPVPILRNARGRVVTPLGTVTIAQPPTLGQVYYSPAPTDFVYDPTYNTTIQSYLIHWKVVDGAGKVVFFPNGPADEIAVSRA